MNNTPTEQPSVALGKAGIRMAKQHLRKFGLRVNTENMDIIVGIMTNHAQAISLLGGTVVWPEDTFKVKGRKRGKLRGSVLTWMAWNRVVLRIHGKGDDPEAPTRTIMLRTRGEVVVREGVAPQDVGEVLEEMRDKVEGKWA